MRADTATPLNATRRSHGEVLSPLTMPSAQLRLGPALRFALAKDAPQATPERAGYRETTTCTVRPHHGLRPCRGGRNGRVEPCVRGPPGGKSPTGSHSRHSSAGAVVVESPHRGHKVRPGPPGRSTWRMRQARSPSPRPQ